MTRASQAIFSVLALCILAATILITWFSISPPASLPADAPVTDFSASRAMLDLDVIAREPHPVGVSAAHAEVRDYLLGQVRALGLEPQVQHTSAMRLVGPGSVWVASVENILVRLPGIDPEGAILLMAHYDSTPGGPGAADNGAGVVTILEILRALSAGPPLQQDLILMFVDGEEPGAMGTHGFVAEHPWFPQVRLVINLDTITDGPATLLRTSSGNGPLAQALARSARRPASISLPYDLLQTGETDLTPFIQSGVPGGDFSATGRFTELHTAAERIELVSPSSVQHIGEQLLALVRYLGDQPTLEMSVPDQTFFPMLGSLVHYPAYLALPLMVLGSLCFVGAIRIGFLKRALNWRGVSWGLFGSLLSLGLSIGIANLLWLGIQSLHPEYKYSVDRPRLSDDYLYAIGFIILTLAVSTFVIAVLHRKVTALNLTAGSQVIWLPASIAASVLVPAASYLFTWVLLSGSIALLLALLVHSERDTVIMQATGLLVSAVLATLLWMLVVYYAFLGASFPSLSLIVGTAGLWLGSMTPLLEQITRPKRWSLPAVATLLTLGFLAAGHFVVGKESPPPLVYPIAYWFDTNQGEAYWVAFSEKQDERASELLADPVQRPYTELLSEAPQYSVLTSSAPMLDLDGPRMEVLADEWAAGRRAVRARITTSIHDSILIFIPKESPLLSIALPNRERTELPPVGTRGWMLRFVGLSPAGIEITFQFSGTRPIEFRLVEEATGLPSFQGLSTQPQPGTMKSPGDIFQGIPTDFTAIKRTFVMQETTQ